MNNPSPAPSKRVTPIQTGNSGFYTQVFREIQSGEIPLPTLPHLALRLRTVVKDENAGFGKLSRILETDPGVASYVLKVANTAAFSGSNRADDLKAAINRLGTRTLVNVVTTYCLRNLFRSRSKELREALREVWVVSARLGATCAVLAREVTRHSPDRALLSGLLANIGALPLIRAVDNRVSLRDSKELLAGVLERYSRQVGVMMLKAWEFDDWLLEVVRNYRQWHYSGSEAANLTDLVLVSDLLIRKSDETTFRPPALDQVPAIARVRARWPKVDWAPALLQQLADPLRDTQEQLAG